MLLKINSNSTVSGLGALTVQKFVWEKNEKNEEANRLVMNRKKVNSRICKRPLWIHFNFICLISVFDNCVNINNGIRLICSNCQITEYISNVTICFYPSNYVFGILPNLTNFSLASQYFFFLKTINVFHFSWCAFYEWAHNWIFFFSVNLIQMAKWINVFVWLNLDLILFTLTQFATLSSNNNVIIQFSQRE